MHFDHISRQSKQPRVLTRGTGVNVKAMHLNNIQAYLYIFLFCKRIPALIRQHIHTLMLSKFYPQPDLGHYAGFSWD